MESNYHSNDFGEIPSNHSHGATDNLEDFCHNFTSSDESFNSNSSSGSGSSSSASKSFEKTNDVMRSNDLSLRSQTSFNGVNNTAARKENHKSFGSIVKMLKNLNLKHEKPSHKRSILRKPTEYTFVKGMSGLNLRVIKPTQSTPGSCQQCLSKN